MEDCLSTQDYFEIMDNIADVVCSFRFDPLIRVAFINRAIVHMSLYTQSDFYDDPGLFLRIIFEEDRPLVEAMLREGHPPQAEFRMCRRDGQIFRVQGNFNDIYTRDHQFLAIQTVLRIIPEDTRLRHGKSISINMDQRVVRYIEELKIISDIGRTLGESLNLNQIIKRLGHAIHRLFPDVHAQYISRYHPEIQKIGTVQKS